MIEPSYKINPDDKTKSPKAQTNKQSAKADGKSGLTVVPDSNDGETPSNSKSGSKAVRENDPLKPDSNTKEHIGFPDISASNSKANITQDLNHKHKTDPDNGLSSSASSNADTTLVHPLDKPSKQDVTKPAELPPTSRHDVEENMVLGVALDGSKRTLPIDY